MSQLELFRIFVAVYRAGSVSRAAHTRHLTQPAVSQQLAALERAVGSPLFRRTPTGVTPTERGRALYNDVFESVDRLERARRSLQAVPDRPRVLHLGMGAEYFEAVALERLVGMEPNLVMTFGSAEDLLPHLEEGVLDTVISIQKPSARSLQHRVLAPKHFLLVGSPDVESLPDDCSVAEVAAHLNAQPWVSYSLEFPITRRFWQQVLHAPFQAERRLVVPDLRAVMRAVELGVGLSILPEYLCAEAVLGGRLREVWPIRERVPAETWVMAYRLLDYDREDIDDLAQRLARPHLRVER